jgi:geranylgeranyl pyrophosphate synthase
MFTAHRLDQTSEEYERRIYGKTASLFAGAAEMGAVIGGAPEGDIQSLRSYGADLGMAFQIVDDVLDLREGTQQLGKPAGHDLTQGTVTLPTLVYASGLTESSDAMTRLRDVVAGNDRGDEDVKRVVAEIRASGAIDAAMERAEHFAEKAKSQALTAPDPETQDMLIEIADIVCNRSA